MKIKIHIKNPWVVTIIGGLLVTGISLIYFYLSEQKKQMTAKNIVRSFIHDADKLLEKNMPEDALAIYEDERKP